MIQNPNLPRRLARWLWVPTLTLLIHSSLAKPQMLQHLE